MSDQTTLAVPVAVLTSPSLGPDAAILYGVLEALAQDEPTGIIEAGETQIEQLSGLTAEQQGAALAALQSAGLIRRGVGLVPHGLNSLRILGGGDQP